MCMCVCVCVLQCARSRMIETIQGICVCRCPDETIKNIANVRRSVCVA